VFYLDAELELDAAVGVSRRRVQGRVVGRAAQKVLAQRWTLIRNRTVGADEPHWQCVVVPAELFCCCGDGNGPTAGYPKGRAQND
jgi:hypothetical protein